MVPKRCGLPISLRRNRYANNLEFGNFWLFVHLRPKVRCAVWLQILDHRTCAADLEAATVVEIVGQEDRTKMPVTVISDDPNDAREDVAVSHAGVLRALKFRAVDFEAALRGAHNIVWPQVACHEACRYQNQREEQVHQPTHAGILHPPSR